MYRYLYHYRTLNPFNESLVSDKINLKNKKYDKYFYYIFIKNSYYNKNEIEIIEKKIYNEELKKHEKLISEKTKLEKENQDLQEQKINYKNRIEKLKDKVIMNINAGNFNNTNYNIIIGFVAVGAIGIFIKYQSDVNNRLLDINMNKTGFYDFLKFLCSKILLKN
jgi:hypothetical protein